jgi:hypothetical protein
MLGSRLVPFRERRGPAAAHAVDRQPRSENGVKLVPRS